MTDETIHGLTLRDCAEIMGKHSELRAQHGEPSFEPHFQRFLGERGIDPNAWANAWNGWWTRMESDPSGQLHARFATLQQEQMQKAHFADVRDMSADVKGGISLEGYAKIMAGLAGGKELGPLLADAGLGEQQWLQAQQEWNAAMGADTNHHLTTQYGQLYAKYTPGFQQQLEGQVAGQMAAHYAQRAAGVDDDEPEEDYGIAHALRDMASSKRAERYRGAHLALVEWDVGDRSDPTLHQAATQAFAVAMDCVEHHDEHAVSDAEALAKDLALLAEEGFLSAEQASDAKGAIARCLARAKEALATREAAFAPIANKAVPERVPMQSAIQDYRSLTEELEEILAEWDENAAEPSSPGSAPSMSPSAPSPGTAMEPVGGGLLELLKSLPIIGNILRALGL
ncbi:MAG: hypothetical protein AAGH15_16400 [Myxococcota bacterium]